MTPPDLVPQVLDDAPDVLVERLRPAGDRLQAKGAEGRGHAPPDRPARDLGQFHRVAADIADQALGFRPAEQHALRRQPRFLGPVDDA